MIKMKLILLIVVISLLSIKGTYGCSCSDILGYDRAAYVFTGKVISIKKGGMYEITMRVKKVAKGEIKSTNVVVYTPCMWDSCCGIKFNPGERYKIFAYDSDGKIYTNLCTETRRIGRKKPRDGKR